MENMTGLNGRMNFPHILCGNNEWGDLMKIGDLVSIHVDEPEYIGKYIREIATVIGLDIGNGFATVQFEDGQIMYFSPFELTVWD